MRTRSPNLNTDPSINASTPKAVGLPPSHPTLPSLLKKAGYGTSLVGKWHLGYLPDYSPLKSGYDTFFGIFGGAADYFNHGADAARSGPNAHQLHEQEVWQIKRPRGRSSPGASYLTLGRSTATGSAAAASGCR